MPYTEDELIEQPAINLPIEDTTRDRSVMNPMAANVMQTEAIRNNT